MHIRVDSISFSYPSGIKALEDVSLEIPRGDMVAFIGQNGAGKTTLVKHLNGLLKPTSGSVFIGGHDTNHTTVASLASVVGYVFQNPDDQLFQSTVRGELSFGPRNLGWSPDKIALQVQKALAVVRMEGYEGKHPYDLMPNQRKLIALASVLAMDTPIIVFDEPTTGQDYAGAELIGEIVDSLKSEGKTVIVVSHDIDFCAEHFSRVVVMARGRILLDGETRSVLTQKDILAISAIEPPQLMRLADRLGMADKPLTVEEFIQYRYPTARLTC